MIRKLKLSYMAYNLFNRSKLRHNTRLYKALRLNKFYFSPVSSKDFEGADPSKLSLHNNVKSLAETDLFKKLSDSSQQSLMDFHGNGFAILRQHVDKDAIARINDAIDGLVNAGDLKFRYENKLMCAYEKVKDLKEIASDKNLTELLSSLLADEAVLFQSINFLSGSEQKTHSDSIHMTTFPLGGLLGVWVALEDIEEDNGPLHYYPGSHKLPYYLNKDYDNEGNFFMLGKKGYEEYEKMIAEKMVAAKLEKKTFTAKAGDLLIWHANLFHGGEPHLNKQKTRKSVVFHYFANNSICYHEISQRPALFE